MIGVPVLMRYSNPTCCRTITVITGAGGRYAVAFEASPNPYSVRAELMVYGYDWQFWDIPASDSPIVADFRLQRVIRIAAGESVEISLRRENGNCQGFHYSPCARLRVTVPADGELTLGTPADGGLDAVAITACCVNGDERGGNPFTMPVTAGDEIWVEVGRSRAMQTIEGRVRVSTSFTPR